MMAIRHRRRAEKSSSPLFSRILIAILLIAITVQAATIFDLFWRQATYVSYIVQIAVFAIFLVYPFFRVNLSMLLLVLGIVAFLIVEHMVFSGLARQKYNFNAILAYFPLLSFFSFYRSGCSTRYILKALAVISFGYVAIYVLAHNWILNSTFEANRSIHAGDVNRGVRIYLAAGFASFVAYYAVMSRSSYFLYRSSAFIMAMIALWLSGFRTFLAIFIAILLLSGLRLLGYGTRLLLFGVFALVSIVLLLGLVIPGWNPFAFFGSDGSAYARSLEYMYAIRSIQSHWVLGVGIAGNFAALQAYLQTPMYEPLYATDLGILGPLFLFGIPGMVAFVAATYFCIVPKVGNGEVPEFRGLRLNAMLCGVLGVISPSLILEQNSVFLSILLVVAARTGWTFGPDGARLWYAALPIDRRSLFQRLFKPISGSRSRLLRRDGTHYAPPNNDK